jgi:hypothetical protein
MPPRRVREVIELSGPLFDPQAVRRFEDAVAAGIEEMAQLGEEILVGYIAQAGFIDTGAFVSSVGYEMHRERGVGYAVVRPTAVWPEPGRPTRTWLERGTRRGVRLRRGRRVFQSTKTRLRQVSLARVFEDRITRALN